MNFAGDNGLIPPCVELRLELLQSNAAMDFGDTPPFPTLLYIGMDVHAALDGREGIPFNGVTMDLNQFHREMSGTLMPISMTQECDPWPVTIINLKAFGTIHIRGTVLELPDYLSGPSNPAVTKTKTVRMDVREAKRVAPKRIVPVYSDIAPRDIETKVRHE